MWEPRRLTSLRASTACYRDSFTFLYLFTVYTCKHRNSYYNLVICYLVALRSWELLRYFGHGRRAVHIGSHQLMNTTLIFMIRLGDCYRIPPPPPTACFQGSHIRSRPRLPSSTCSVFWKDWTPLAHRNNWVHTVSDIVAQIPEFIIKKWLGNLGSQD
jgi:hypothetical protein